MGNLRHQTILRLIQEQPVSTQEQLRDLLAEQGFAVTQATISRDITQLQLRKKRGSGGVQRYVREHGSNAPSKLLEDTVIKVDYAMNTVVLQCHSGTAQAAATVLDSLALEAVVGSIAGDDTIFMLTRSEENAKALAAQLTTQIFG